MQFTVWWVIYVDVHRPNWDSVCICYPPTYKLPDYSLWSVLPLIFKTFNTWQPLLFLYRRFAFYGILCKWNYSVHTFMSYFLLIIINLSLIHGILCIRIHSFFFSLLFSMWNWGHYYSPSVHKKVSSVWDYYKFLWPFVRNSSHEQTFLLSQVNT